MMDTFSMHQGYSVPAVVTGKPVAIGGSQGWAHASGRGTAILCRELAALEGFSLRGARVAVQGCGPIGATAAQILAESGCAVVALADGEHGLQHRTGLDVAAALRYYNEHASLEGCPAGEALAGGTLAGLACDVLVLSGFERVDAQTAAHVQARLIVEGAYGALLPEADHVLEQRGIPVLPAVLGGSGGAVASYFEWVQDLQETFWSENEINEQLSEILVRALRAIYTRHQQRGISLRLAADSLAVQMVADAHRIRGLYP
jgi:glutamate dehydrogenase (NAD(P)+)